MLNCNPASKRTWDPREINHWFINLSDSRLVPSLLVHSQILWSGPQTKQETIPLTASQPCRGQDEDSPRP